MSFKFVKVHSICVQYFNGNAFPKCLNLQIIEFEEDSEMKSLYPYDFEGFKLIMVPKKLRHFFENALGFN